MYEFQNGPFIFSLQNVICIYDFPRAYYFSNPSHPVIRLVITNIYMQLGIVERNEVTVRQSVYIL